ncbi:hypothetical protein PFNF54_04078 [Plasmodium falciparum NF54]|uniref:Erythrocyte membrane protein 1 n=1 Tax=Plasmodium falciparum (isolate NF54) TaxID=5843 RepID=W7JQ64_PLAFO|nr:hypothetical protein PFNF54_04078 [Plasmodium falciparum NF54]
MGNTQSSEEEEAKSPSLTESHNSARGVLEEIGKKIKDKTEKESKHVRQLKGKLSNAKFADRLYKESGGDLRSAYSDACSLTYKFHTNITTDGGDGRHPCHGRENNRFSESQEYGCSNVYIKGNENNSNGTACVPPRRRHICDQNLEFLDNPHTDDTDDLLGNVLVTAKYEGNYIVSNHPDKNSNGNKSGICTSLARSFADIGDIVRGRDMFKSNEKVEIGLKKVFEKINNGLKKIGINDYNDISGNYYKLREAWWTANRDQVWKAITCRAPNGANYFRKGLDGKIIFSDNGPCGRKELIVPTYLDYVPQFLRWLNEWSEEFCRIKNIKIGNIKKSCTGESNNKHCSREGYDCNKTNLRLNEIFMDLECPRCADDCKSYETWVEKKKKEFNKQKKKYEKEVDATQNNDNNENGIYNKKFYDELKSSYKEVNSFFELLNKGPICEHIDKKIPMDYNNTEKTFSRSEYCKSCPITDILCDDNECKTINEFKCREIKSMPNIRKNENETPIDIDILVNVNNKKVITHDLKNNYENCDLFKKLGEQKWKCKYKCYLDVCEPRNLDSNIYNERYISIKVLFKRWLEYFLEDYNKLKEKLNPCMYNVQEIVCINECKQNCECVEKWIKEKREEWKKIKDRYVQQYESKDEDVSSKLKKFLKQELFTNYVKNALDKDETLDSMKESTECIDPNKPKGKPCNNNDVINILLNRLEKQIDNCKKKHEEKGEKPCVDIPKLLNDEDEDEDDDETPRAHNPCVDKNDSQPTKTVSYIARQMHRRAKAQMTKNSVVDGDNKLEGDIFKVTFRNGGVGKNLNGDICKIDKTYSNDSRGTPTDGPCEGKGDRFKIGTDWQGDSFVNPQYRGIYMPPRRQHFCTSNLEKLDVSRVIRNGNASNSLLGDVLLAAKYEAERTKNHYVSKKEEHSEACRAVRYSFADLGDIIRGKDMWDKNHGEKKTQENLERIFAKIKEQLLNSSIKDKYKDDDKATPKYKQLREDWWEANRSQVWEAMQCPPKNGTFPCKSDHTPLHDYIPQRLRWMTEWAEWYCKEQSRLYGELVETCGKCMHKGKCKQGNGHCVTCKPACEKYKKFINTWQPQWKQMEQKYSQLYEEAKKYNDSSRKDTTNKDDYVLQFLNKLLTQNKGNKTYDTAEGYVHQEAHISDCQKQTQFCKKRNGEIPSSDTETDNNYAFRPQPHDHDEVCECNTRQKTKVRKKKKKVDACEMAKTLLHNNDGTIRIGQCKRKDEGNAEYPKWDCNSQIHTTHNGACMPPRRQKLCVYFFANPSQIGSINKQDNLRKAFIISAAAETFRSWQYYKSKNGGENLQTQLKDGTIPDDFKRQMFYTYGDYRDFLFGTDISKGLGEGTALEKQINILFPNGVRKIPNEKTREKWWTDHGPEIWKGMLCALTNGLSESEKKTKIFDDYSHDKVNQSKNGNPSLEDFAKKPQFFRWFIEWSDEFCRERKKKEEEVERDCKDEYEGCEKEKNGKCVTACKAYKEYITNKKEEYDSQKGKFDVEKTEKKQGYEDYSEKQASEYLKEKCIKSSCNCMKKVTEISNYWTNPHKTYDTENLGIKCECPPSPCTIVDGILSPQNSSSYAEGCKWKYGKMSQGGTEWDCSKKSGGEGGNEDGDVVCIPPRRRRLYVKNLQDLTGEESLVDLRKAFIKCAAIETFFAWHEFKKEKEREEKEKNEQDVQYKSSVLENLQKQLKNGEIDDEFKRQMFYTFADYRDICLGKDIGNDVDGINEKIDTILQKNGKPNNIEEYKKWWQKHGHEIWEGMLCALSYNTETKEMDKELRNKLTEQKNGNKNTYDTVTISGGPIGNTKLEKFASRPPFFRWLEEWADEFCRKRTHKLEKIQNECKGVSGTNQCDDDGFDCDEMCPKKDGSFETFKCLSCAKSCRFYKKWISRKKEEFDKQSKKYENEIDDVKHNSDNIYGKDFLETLDQQYKSVELFLEKVKGPCSINNNNEECKIDFNKPKDTFGHAKNCGPCSEIRFKCIEDNSNWVTTNTCNKTTFKFTEDNKDTKEDSEQLGMLISDNTVQNFADGLQNDCKDADIFKGLRKDQWSCGYFCNLDICSLKTSHGENNYKQNILIRALFKRWLEHFLEDYNKINDKISHCMKNGEGSTCIKGCEIKCNCVSNWIKKKTLEWEIVRDRFFKQYNVDSEKSFTVKSFLEQAPFDSDVQKAIKPFEKLRDFEDSIVCNGTTSARKEKGTEKDVVICLLDKLQKQIETCQTKHKETSGNTCSPPPNPDTQTDTPLPLESFPPPFCNVPPNPCGDKDATNVVGVEVLAKEMQEAAHKSMLSRSAVDSGKGDKGESSSGKSSLEGDISLAEFKNGFNPSGLKNVCQITEKHSYANGASKDPCNGKGNGKDQRFKIETQWKDTGKSGKHVDVYLPPRREHICTSNLEYLLKGNSDQIMKVGNNKINHSFLGEVLLAAKYEAEFIKTNYTRLNGQNDNGAKCRAMKYSFADIGDIVRGRDLWEHNDFKKLERDLVKIFGKIKEGITDETTKKQYEKDDTDNKQLRCDWWEANRDQVWEAMQCKTTIPPVTTSCDTTTVTPLVDYIPQRLRWMMEWAEWYCKYQSKAYSELRKGCEDCRSWKCMKGDSKCENCTKACKDYNSKIEPWKQQWTKIKEKYEELYKKAQNSDTSNSGTTYPKDEKDVVSFLSKLHEKNKDNKIYYTAAGYIHQQAKYLDCTQQTHFCDKKNGETLPSGRDNDKYAFKKPPKKYERACKCHEKQEPPPPKVPEDSEDDRERSEPGEDALPVLPPEEIEQEEEPEETSVDTTQDEEEPASEGGGPSGSPTEESGEPRENSDSSDPKPDQNPEANPEQTPILKPEEEAPPKSKPPDGDRGVGRSLGPTPRSEVEPEESENEDVEDEDDEEEEEDPDDDPEAESEEEDEDHGGQEAEAVPPQPQAPAPLPPPPPPLPPLKTALMSSTIMWSVGIGFAAISYFLLKKKKKKEKGI